MIAIEIKLVPIKVVLFPCWVLPLLVLATVVTAVVVDAAVVVESVLSPEQTVVERHYGLPVKAKRELTNYNCSNERSSCGIS